MICYVVRGGIEKKMKWLKFVGKLEE